MKRKKQPSAEVYREQLRLAADEIIGLRTFIEGVAFVTWRSIWPTSSTEGGHHDPEQLARMILCQPKPRSQWWRKLFATRKIK